jgi:hypothetical protein
MDASSDYTFKLRISSCIQTDKNQFEEKKEEFEITIDPSILVIQKYEHEILDNTIEL